MDARSVVFWMICFLGAGTAAADDIEDCWAPGGAPDHCDITSDMRYDIWQANCHTAANVSVCNDPGSTGIVVCGGTPEGPGNPGDHTFVYVLT